MASTKHLFNVNLGLDVDNSYSIIHGSGLPGASGGIADTVDFGSIYKNDSDGTLWKKVSQGTGSSRWSEIGSGSGGSSSNLEFSINDIVSSTVNVDEVNTTDIITAKWIYTASETGTGTRESGEILAVHNGFGSTDADKVDYNVYAQLRTNGIISGLGISVDINGTGPSQVMQLKVTAGTTSVDFNATRIRVLS